jgi:arylsulfatase A-like enzyme
MGVARRARALLSIFAGLGVLAGCSANESETPPNILLISIDTLRRDHVSAYGYERETTPRLDELASEGALFLDAVSSSNWTLPAHMSLMTGLAPPMHGVEEDTHALSPSILTMAEVLQENGYATAGFTSHIYVSEKYGFARGFDVFETEQDQPAESVTSSVIGWLSSSPWYRSEPRRPFFAFAHYFDPHWGYTPPASFAQRFGTPQAKYGDATYLLRRLDPKIPMDPDALPDILMLYDAEIAYTDHHIGRILDWLREAGELDHTIVAVVSDHGEEFGDHGSFGHATHLHAEVTRVPMILRYPAGVKPGKRPRLSTLSDLPATILHLAGLAVPAQLSRQGRDLFGPEEPDPGGSERIVMSESTRWGPRRFALRTQQHALLSGGSYDPIVMQERYGRTLPAHLGTKHFDPALYDRTRDPDEQKSLASRIPDSELSGYLLRRIEKTLRTLRLECDNRVAGAEYRVRLRFDPPLIDEPFRLDSREAASISSHVDAETHVRLRPAAGVSPIYFPIDRVDGQVHLELARDREPVMQGSFPIPAAGKVRRLTTAGGADTACSIAATRPSHDAIGERADLSADDKDALRALGYIE